MNQPFTNPFRYEPHPLVREAARLVMERLDRLISDGMLPEEVCRGLSEGKMLGVLVCRGISENGCCTIPCPEPRPDAGNGVSSNQENGPYCFLAAFSGSVGGQSTVDGFVPPIYDLLDPTGYFKEREAEISALNGQISLAMSDLGFKRMNLEERKAERDKEITALQERKSRLKKERKLILKEWDADGRETLVYTERFVRESQYENAEYKRAKDRWKEIIGPMEAEVNEMEEKIRAMKQQRAAMSEELQKWIFRQYIVMNGLGEESPILDIFAAEGLIPPGGTGDCAAPKLLNHAFRHGMKPVAMGEFWYGKSPDTAVRTAGHFYPSCTSKCGPLLKYMLKGLELPGDADPADSTESGLDDRMHQPQQPSSEGRSLIPDVIYEDEAILVVDKPSGMPSVPGLDGRESAQEWLQKRALGAHEIHAVHRLDMDTSGLLLFAKTGDAAANLRRQFEERTVKKTYRALLCPGKLTLMPGTTGTIDLPLAPDYDERPRQKVDLIQGKQALTEYEVLRINQDGTTEVLFHPVTGRTHQLRVHSAHHLGLGRPIVGDLLYGGAFHSSRLRLHAQEISFIHPITEETVEFKA